jgi:hypothetical protein
MTRAERLHELDIGIYVLERLRETVQLPKWEKERLEMLRRERGELTRQMGAADRRAYEGLKS